MDLVKEFREDTIDNVLRKHNLTLGEAFELCLHHNGGKDIPEGFKLVK